MTLARLGRKAGLESEFALCFDGLLSQELVESGAVVHRLGEVRFRRPLSVMRARKRLAALMRERRYDAVLVHSGWAQALFGPTVQRTGVPLWVYLHGPADGTSWLDRLARSVRPDGLLANSRFTAESAARAYPGQTVHVVYLPVDDGPVVTTEERRALRTSLGAMDDTVVILTVGRMEPGKGQPLLLEALAAMPRSRNWSLWLVGGAQRPEEQAYQEQLRQQAARSGLDGRVRFLGHRSDARQLMRAADIFCQANTSPESFGIVFVEALYAGVPAVATTASGGATEIVDENCGRVVEPQPLPLGRTLGELVENPTLRAKLGGAGPARAESLCEPIARLAELRHCLDAGRAFGAGPRPAAVQHHGAVT